MRSLDCFLFDYEN